MEGEDLNTSEIGLMWRKPAGLFHQAADELRTGSVYRCVDLWADRHCQYMASLKISETSIIHRCYDLFTFKCPLIQYDGQVD